MVNKSAESPLSPLKLSSTPVTSTTEAVYFGQHPKH